MILSLVANADHHKNVSGSFPHGVECTLDVVYTVWDADFLFYLVFLVSDNLFGVFVSSQIISFEVPFVIVSGLEPGNHRVIVGLLDNVLVSPLSFFELLLMSWF
jgi:hypothetical protein